MYLRKHRDGDIEYISASDVFRYMNEMDSKTQEVFSFLYIIEQYLNYFNNNSSTAFGNPDLARLESKIAGYCMAKHWTVEENREFLIIKSGKRNKFIIEKPAVPKSEINNRRDIRNTLNNLGL